MIESENVKFLIDIDTFKRIMHKNVQLAIAGGAFLLSIIFIKNAYFVDCFSRTNNLNKHFLYTTNGMKK